MLSTPLDLGRVEATRLFDFLYGFFHRDFIGSRTLLNKTIYVNPRRWLVEDGKEKDFWHLTSRIERYQVRRGNRYVMEEERLPDYARSERIEWVRQIIMNHSHPRVRLFYHQESNRKRDIRLYLWAFQDDFVVILQKLGGSKTFLVTSFYIDRQGKRDDYESRYNAYSNGTNSRLNGCEWF